eukprot:2951622-Pyramimonas_sp.AAC.1
MRRDISASDLLGARVADSTSSLGSCELSGAPLAALQKGELMRFLGRVAEIGGAPPPDVANLGGRPAAVIAPGGPP